MTENKRYFLKYSEYNCSNGETIQADPYYVDKKGEFIDTDYFTIDGYATMSDEQVLDLLNENEELQEDLNDAINRIEERSIDIQLLKKENEQLKRIIQKLEFEKCKYLNDKQAKRDNTSGYIFKWGDNYD